MSAPTPEQQLKAFIAAYTPEMARRIRAARKRMRALFPRGFELVYDNYNALAIGYAPSQRASDVAMSIAAYPRWVSLFFLRGAGFADPQGVLQGAGNQVRHIVLSADLAAFDQPAVRGFIAQALVPRADTWAQAGALQTVIKSVSAKQRPRRPDSQTKV